MTTRKKILLSIDPDLLFKTDLFAKAHKLSRSALIAQALLRFLEGAENKPYRLETLAQGYRAMGAINLVLAEEALPADNEQFITYEQFLSESESH